MTTSVFCLLLESMNRFEKDTVCLDFGGIEVMMFFIILTMGVANGVKLNKAVKKPKI